MTPVRLPAPLILLTGILLLTAVVVVVAYLVGRFRPSARKRLRRLVVPYGLHLVALAFAEVGELLERGEAWVTISLHLAWLLKMLLLINAAAIALFDLILPALRVRLPQIVPELSVASVYVIALLAFLRSQGVNPSSLVATSAVATAIIAFSMQATLGNVFGGIALQIDDSIHVGDWVRLEPDTEGLVREIGWRHTVIETRNWDTVIVPNAALLSQRITILGKRGDGPIKHRMWVHFNVDFRFSPAQVIETVEQGLSGTPIPGVAAEPAPNCICLDFARDGRDSFAHYAVRYWLTDLAADDPTSSAVRVRLFATLRRAEIPLAVPAATVFVSADDVDHAARKAERERSRRQAALTSVELLAGLTDGERAQLEPRMRYAPFAAGEVITRQGAEAHWLYLVLSGKVQVRVAHENRDCAVADLTAPSFFGEHGVMTGEPRAATVVALTEVECYRLDRAAFADLLRARPEMARDFSRLLAERQQALLAARDALDAQAHAQRAPTDHHEILKVIQRFFGLSEDADRPRPSG
jgi:CRP-like cAMP-binding protein/small-conductance mechanosensitive channel